MRRRAAARVRARLTLCALLATGSCLSPALQEPGGERSWALTLDDAKQAVLGGRYDDADSILAGYARRHAFGDERFEAEYWRAIFLLDPGNPGASNDQGIAALDRYLAARPSLPHRREAVTLRRIAAELRSARQLAAASAAAPVSAPTLVVVDDSTAKPKDDEVQRLRAELAKANEELERIRKRLTAKP